MYPHILRCAFAASLLCTVLAAPVRADLTLQSAYSTAGFNLGTLAFNFAGSPSPSPYNCCGPLGIAFPSTGGMMISTYPGNNYVFPSYSTLGQNAAVDAASVGFGFDNTIGLTRSGTQLFTASQYNSAVYRINNDGSYASTLASGLTTATSLATNPSNGHVFSGGAFGIADIDQTSGAFTIFNGTIGFFDGLTFSADGTRLYGEANGNIYAFDTSNGSTPLFSFAVPDGPDGVAIGSGSLAGKLYINNNGGTLYEYDLGTSALTLMASGGSRGDFVAVAPDGALLITQSDRVLRLTAPEGGGFENTNVPEPGSLSLLGLALAGFGATRRRRAA